MKKLILSLFMVAICGLAHAGNAVEPSKIVKFASKVSVTIKVVKISSEDVECTNTYIPICDGGNTVGYMAATVCDSNLVGFLISLNC